MKPIKDSVLKSFLILIFPNVFQLGCVGFFPLDHKCTINEFSDIVVRENRKEATTNLVVTGWRNVDSATGVKGMVQEVCNGVVFLSAYTGPFWLKDNKALIFTVDLTNVHSVYFSETLIWTQECGIQEDFRKTKKTTDNESIDAVLDDLGRLEVFSDMTNIVNIIDKVCDEDLY